MENNAGPDSAAECLVRLLVKRSFFLAAAESCTAGLVADALARVPGASTCFWGSFVCYTSRAKIKMLGVGEDTLNKYGAVSKETARAMILGVLKKSDADAVISITGLAGPGGDGSAVPVGTVWIAAALRRSKRTETPCTVNEAELDSIAAAADTAKFHFSGSRNDVRRQAVKKALEQLTELLEKNG